LIFLRFRTGILAAALFALAVYSTQIHAQSAETSSAQASKTLTVEDIFAKGPIAGGAPQGLTWSPDGQHLTYLDGGELLDLDPGTGKPHILVSRAKLGSLSGNSVNEKDRDHRARYGMASYLWAPDSAHLLFDTNGSLWLYDLKTGTGLNIGASGSGSGNEVGTPLAASRSARLRQLT